LTVLNEEEIIKELSPGDGFRRRFPPPNLQWLAYPYGYINPAVVGLAKTRFRGALAVDKSFESGSWDILRTTVLDTTSFSLTS
jgi:hypothetical protein